MKTSELRLIAALTIVFSFYFGVNSAQTYETNTTQEKSDFQWPEGKKMALSLSFDDARLTQIENGIPIFDKYGIKVTFYVSLGDMIKRLESWKIVAKNGHDIGNHSVLHPCSGNFTWSRQEALRITLLQECILSLTLQIRSLKICWVLFLSLLDILADKNL